MSSLCLLAAAAFALAPLARFWSANPEYAYGWGVPMLAAYLAWERWRDRPEPRSIRSGSRTHAGLVLVLVLWSVAILGARLALETEPASRPLLWLNTSLLVSSWLAWTALLGGRPWLRHFAFPIAFLLVGVPWIFGVEFLVVQNLMRLNAAAVAGTLDLLGLPARAAGNTIILATGQLGVSEACSGVRSLQAALMMSLFLGEFYRFGLRERGALLGAGAGLALVGNFARMLYLAWRGAHDGVAAVEAAHDSTGWLILVFTVVSLWVLCVLTRPERPLRTAARCLPVPARRMAAAWAVGIFAATLFAEAATQGWYGWRERSAPHTASWTVAWPQDEAGFVLMPVSETVRATLHAQDASAASWRDDAGAPWSGLWIRYSATAEGKVVFESHNPSLCLPAAGWKANGVVTTFPLRVNGIDLRVQTSTFAVEGGSARVFWIPYLVGGVRAAEDEEPGLYGHSLAALFNGRFPLLQDIWAGCRGARAETLELALVGSTPSSDDEQAFRRLAGRLIRPDAPRSLASSAR